MFQETIYTKHTYTNEELLKISGEMAQAASNKKEKEDSLKSISSSLKADINLQDAKLNSCGEAIRTGYKMVSHLCNIIYDHKKKLVNYQDADTKEIVESRPMTDKEQLQFAEEPKKEK
jgi:hypothetical protein